MKAGGAGTRAAQGQQNMAEEHNLQGDVGDIAIALVPSEQDQEGKQMHHTTAGHLERR